MSMHDELDLLDEAQKEAEQQAETMVFDSDLDRRKFVFLSLTTAAATTFGFGAKVLAQGAAGGAAGAGGAAAPAGRGGGGRGGQGGAPPVPLENMEAMSWTFQPYPGGTGALLEKTYREKGAAAFARQKFSWAPGVVGTFYIDPAVTLPATDEELAFLPAHRLAALIHAKKLTATRLTKLYLDRLNRYNPILNCAVTIMADQAMAEAAKADADIKAGNYKGPLHGLPWGVKDLFAAKGAPTTWGAGDFANRVFDFDAEIVVRLRNAGAILIAKLASGQFAQGDGWERGPTQVQTKNPWNTSGGSSGSSAGPASATAAGCVAFGVGTETAGSIVSPTTTCGLSALRPTFGRVSRAGGMVLGWSQDRVGPITRTAQDAAMVFNVLHGADEKDPGTITMPFHFNSNINLANLRIGVRPNQTPEFAAFLGKLQELGAKTHDLAAPAIAGDGGSFNPESAAAFDFYVQAKAKEMGVEVASLVGQGGRGGGGGGGGGGGRGAAPDTTAAGRGAAAADSTAGRAGRGGGGGGRGGARTPVIAPDGHEVIDGQLNRWTQGRTMTAMDFINGERRRLIEITAWQAYLKDTDLYIGASDSGARTGHPDAVVQYAFSAGGGRGGGGRGGAPAAPPAPAPAAPSAPQIAVPGGPLTSGNPQPRCTQIIGNLYNDDLILSVAHKYQTHTDWLKERPKLG